MMDGTGYMIISGFCDIRWGYCMGKYDTIAAIATGMTDSGIGIIRISGENAVKVGNGLFQSPSGKKILHNAESHRLYYGFAVDEEKNDVIDEVMAVVMKAPKSYTGEDIVEIQCHGGVLVMRKILTTVLKCGARLAEPGEFTKRAFLNGRMDLSRAEAVMDVISSQNEAALAASIKQLRGALSDQVRKLRGEILYEIAFIESALDDPEHMSLDGYPERLYEKIVHLTDEIGKLIAGADDGRLIKEGINTVIVGKPNAGKSSFLNYLLGEERAIVTEIAGTTRDVLQDTVRLGNINLNIVDTAGIRQTQDKVEKIGVEKARKYAQDADLIVYVVDTSIALDENDSEIISLIENKNIIVLMNKNDLVQAVTQEEVEKLFQGKFVGKKKPVMLKISAKAGEGMEDFEHAVKDLFFHGEIGSSNEVVITNLRHKEALQESFDSLMLVKGSIETGMPEDFYSIDLMNAYASLGRIIGEEINDDLVDEIFSKFCMGK